MNNNIVKYEIKAFGVNPGFPGSDSVAGGTNPRRATKDDCIQARKYPGWTREMAG